MTLIFTENFLPLVVMEVKGSQMNNKTIQAVCHVAMVLRRGHLGKRHGVYTDSYIVNS